MSQSKPVTILVVEAVQLIRAGLIAVLAKTKGLRVIGEAADGDSALRSTLALHPTVVLMNIGLPGMNGVEALKQIKSSYPEVRVVIFTSHYTDDHLIAALSAGADGYCLKGASSELLVLAIRTVVAGVLWLDPFFTRRVVDATVRGLSQPPVRPKRPRSPENLSDREFDVLCCLGMG